MLLEQALRQSVDLQQSLKVLDLCAAPGGKSTLLQSVISSESLLVANEVIQSRVNILKENLIKWGGMNTVITQNDPKDFQRLPGFFDVVVIDAPCSGSGLFRRDPTAMNEWSLSAVQHCVERQRRIIADAWSTLAQEGILIYATCSFSKQENEEQVDWILNHFEVESMPLTLQEEWGIRETITDKNGYGYRCWPHLAKGEGFFLAVYRKHASE
jgi:16S rRNA C967 or C1407 C5-methylase (RsmB/RsmF family)